MSDSSSPGTTPAYVLPPIGGNPGNSAHVTTPGSFANPACIKPGSAGAATFSSPNAPGIPGLPTKTAWDFMPADWACVDLENYERASAWQAPEGFAPVTQLEHARLGTVTPQMQRVAEREPHLSPEQVRDEVAAGRMVIPANVNHLQYKLDPMCIGRASKTKINANMGASPVSSSTDEEVEKLQWAEKWGADTVMDLSTGGDLDATREALIQNSTTPIGTVPIYSMIIGR
ncbi:MAG: phosphomethylpyrimidine synthase ThiC, partial [Planctomycetota bacterium]